MQRNKFSMAPILDKGRQEAYIGDAKDSHLRISRNSMKDSPLLVVVIILLLVGGIYALTRTSSISQDESDAPSVAATIFPVYDLARQITGDRMAVQLIIEPGVSEHSFEASPALTQKLAKTDMVFFVGAGLDDWVKDVAPSNSKRVDLSTTIDLIEVEDDEEFLTGKDPHYWLSPKNAVLMAGTIRDELVALDPDGKEIFDRNHQMLVEDLKRLDEESQLALSVLSSRNIATFHEAWSYFARDYDLWIVATFEPFPGQTPSPEDLAEYEEAIRTHGLETIFAEPQLASDALKQVAKDVNVRLKVLDPVGGVPGRDSYRRLTEYNVATIRNALTSNN